MSAVIHMNLESVRRFNRYYARVLGVFNQNYLGSELSVTEVRILGEIGRNDRVTAQMLAEYLDLDKSYLSRVIRKLEAAGLLSRERAAEDGRKLYLHLTEPGMELHTELDRRSNERIARLLESVEGVDCEALVQAMEAIREILLPVFPDRME